MPAFWHTRLAVQNVGKVGKSFLHRKQKAKLNKDRKVTGLGGEKPPKFELLTEEIINISEDTEAKSLQGTNHKKEVSDNAKNEWERKVEQRKVALESMGETKKKEIPNKIVPKRWNTTGNLTQKLLSF